ncbi:MAG: murein biosynthesis integral membrane protein MurJ [bacterium]|nr:murein biosynthesis integral membrane protein MurJ [bacterium]
MASAEEEIKQRDGADLVGRHRRLLSRTALVSGLTLVSRILGYVREMVSAALFGDRSAVYDAFITAWRIPNLFRRFLGEGALSTSFQTSLTRTDGTQGEEAGRALFHATLRMVTWILLALCVVVTLAVLAMPDAMPFTGWRWLGADPEPVRDLVSRLMPFVVLVCLSALIGGALQVRGHFASPAWAPAAMNVAWIGALVVVGVSFGWTVDPRDMDRHMAMTRALAWGVLAAGVVQLVVQVPALRAQGLIGGARVDWRSARGEAGAVLRRAAPLAVGAAVYQINVMLDGLMAEGLLPDGGPTLHYYANRVQQFPMALIAVAATSAVFPALQAHGHRGDRQAVRALHDRTHRAIAFVALPASIGLYALSEPVIRVSFEHGAFGAEGVERTAGALRMLCFAILPAGAMGLVARTFYALSDFRTPVVVSSAMLVLNVALNLFCIRVLSLDVDGLALATATTSWVGLAVLFPLLRRRLHLPAGEAGVASALSRMLLAALGCGLSAWWVESLARESLGGAGALGVAILLGMGVYLVLVLLLRVPEAKRLRGRAR